MIDIAGHDPGMTRKGMRPRFRFGVHLTGQRGIYREVFLSGNTGQLSALQPVRANRHITERSPAKSG